MYEKQNNLLSGFESCASSFLASSAQYNAPKVAAFEALRAFCVSLVQSNTITTNECCDLELTRATDSHEPKLETNQVDVCQTASDGISRQQVRTTDAIFKTAQIPCKTHSQCSSPDTKNGRTTIAQLLFSLAVHCFPLFTNMPRRQCCDRMHGSRNFSIINLRSTRSCSSLSLTFCNSDDIWSRKSHSN